MRTDNGEELLDHVVYRDSNRHLLGREGIGPVATSLHDDGLKAWNRALLPRVAGATNPYPSLCYLVFAEEAALLYRERDRLSDRARPQDFAHVLIGSRHSLRADRALGMLDWQWPTGEKMRSGDYAPHVTRIRASQFANAADAGLRRLRASAAGVGAELERPFIEQVKHNPDQTFVVLTDQDSTLAVRLLDALISELGSGVIDNGFSTYEENYHDRLELPRFVFSTGRLAVPRSYQFSRKVLRFRSTDDKANYTSGAKDSDEASEITETRVEDTAGVTRETHTSIVTDTGSDVDTGTGGHPAKEDTDTPADTGTTDEGPDGTSKDGAEGPGWFESPAQPTPPPPASQKTTPALPPTSQTSPEQPSPLEIRQFVRLILRDGIQPSLARHITNSPGSNGNDYCLLLGQAVYESLLTVDAPPTPQAQAAQQQPPQESGQALGDPRDQIPGDVPFSNKDWLLIVLGATFFMFAALFAGVFL